MRALTMAVVLLLVAAEWSFAATGDPAMDLFLQKLVEKRVLSNAEAKELEKELTYAVSERNRRQEELIAAAGESAARELPFELKMRGQTRFDVGDLLIGADDTYKTESDLFLRRVRLEVEKEFEHLLIGKELELNITFDADRTEQDFRGGERRDPSNRVDLQYLYADWTFVDAFSLKIGKHKLPFSRVSLTSSARQLLIERPAATEAAKDGILGDYQQAQLQFHGDLADGALRYYVAYGDGANSLGRVQDLDSDAAEVRKQRWGSAYLARLEIAPLGFTGKPGRVEKRKDDTGIGEDNHLTLGVHAGRQRDIRYTVAVGDADGAQSLDANLDTRLFGADLAGRYTVGTMATLTGQLEYVSFKRDFNYKADEDPDGYYMQLGCLLAGTILRGNLEPALRYGVFDHDRVENAGGSGSKERTATVGFNHYLANHDLKWSYNFVHTTFDEGIAEAPGDRRRKLHQVQLQLNF